MYLPNDGSTGTYKGVCGRGSVVCGRRTGREVTGTSGTSGMKFEVGHGHPSKIVGVGSCGIKFKDDKLSKIVVIVVVGASGLTDGACIRMGVDVGSLIDSPNKLKVEGIIGWSNILKAGGTIGWSNRLKTGGTIGWLNILNGANGTELVLPIEGKLIPVPIEGNLGGGGGGKPVPNDMLAKLICILNTVKIKYHYS